KGGPTVTAVLEMRRVSKVYGAPPVQVRALVDADLTVRSGEMVAVMGPSGSGKSTLLAIAGTLQTPTDGEVRVAGRPLAGMSRDEKAALRRRFIGFVFQDFNLLPGLTATENVALPWGWTGSAAGPPTPPRGSFWASSALPTVRHISPTTSPAANVSGWRSRAPSSATAGCCWPTSPPVRSTRWPAR